MNPFLNQQQTLDDHLSLMEICASSCQHHMGEHRDVVVNEILAYSQFYSQTWQLEVVTGDCREVESTLCAED